MKPKVYLYPLSILKCDIILNLMLMVDGCLEMFESKKGVWNNITKKGYFLFLK